MPAVMIIPMSIDELFAAALDQARRARDEIFALVTTALDEGETPADRSLKVAPHAIALADAFTLIDQLANDRRPASPPQTTTTPSEPQGCVPEDVN